MSETTGQFLGMAYVATRRCGRVSAMAWADAMDERDIKEFDERCRARGDNVQLIERFAGDPWPEWVGECNPPCACKGEAE